MTDSNIQQWLEKNAYLLKPYHKLILNRLIDSGVTSIYQVKLDNWKEAGGLEPWFIYFSQMRDSFYVMKQTTKPYQYISIKQ